MLDGRQFPEIEDGWLFAWVDSANIDHTTAVSQSDITYLPFEKADGTRVAINGAISQVSSANRTAILALLETNGIPTDDITGTNTVADVVKRIAASTTLMQLLQYVDFRDIGFNATIADIPSTKRKAVLRRLTNRGFDVSGITLQTTVREAIKYLLGQNVISVSV
jgi:hypothetical protein